MRKTGKFLLLVAILLVAILFGSMNNMVFADTATADEDGYVDYDKVDNSNKQQQATNSTTNSADKTTGTTQNSSDSSKATENGNSNNATAQSSNEASQAQNTTKPGNTATTSIAQAGSFMNGTMITIGSISLVVIAVAFIKLKKFNY